MSTFDDDENGIETSMPREGIEITATGMTPSRIATGDQPVIINGNIFMPSPAQRGEITVNGTADPSTIEITLPFSHPYVNRWLRDGIPPQQPITITVYRYQVTSAQYEQVWSGIWLSVGQASKHLAKIVGNSRLGVLLQQPLPVATAARTCPHRLYDPQCTVDKPSHTVTTTVASWNGTNVVVASMGGNPDGWAKFGDLLHVPSGQVMTIGSQIGTTLTLVCPIAELRDGDAVQVFAGCDHSIVTCNVKFANTVNFGGMIALPNNNPFLPGQYGVVNEAE